MNLFLEKLKHAWRSRTILFGLFVAVLGYIETARADIDSLLDAINMSWLRPFIWPLVGMVMVYLRWTTTKPLNELGDK